MFLICCNEVIKEKKRVIFKFTLNLLTHIISLNPIQSDMFLVHLIGQ